LNKANLDKNRSDYTAYQKKRIFHWNMIARKDKWKVGWGNYYQKRLQKVLQFVVPPGQSVLEIGCGQGDLLAALKPAYGVGVDFSMEMIGRAKGRYQDLHFFETDAHELDLNTKFDFIILSDLIDDLWDVQKVLEQISVLCHPRTRLFINSYSRLWEPMFKIAEILGVAKPKLVQNWLTVGDIADLLNLAGFEVIRSWQEILWPVRTPLIAQLCNKVLVKIWPFKILAMTNFIMARPCPEKLPDKPLVSVIVPARNEAGNIAQIFSRAPEMGAGTELVFVEGHSHDDTFSVIEREIAAHPERKCQLHRQTGVGKGDAVRLGFASAKGDLLLILDADMTVPPEDLPRFYNALHSGRGEFINGVRLVYPMQDEAMRFFNFLGNKFFSLAFSWLLGQPIKDTLCGTKALWKRDYMLIAANRKYFGDFDPFGDYDLIFGAAKLGLKIADLPIRYRARTYGSTNIRRWSHGWLLLRMVFFAAGKIKFV
jgi:SAM-dependent methyltransferase